MRRFLAIFVLFVVGCSTVAPLALASAYAETPACCRRDGKHHCQSGMADMAGMPGMVDASPSGHQITAPGCPQRSPSATPVANGQAVTPLFSTPQVPDASLAWLPNHLEFVSEPVHQHSGRGPPASL